MIFTTYLIMLDVLKIIGYAILFCSLIVLGFSTGMYFFKPSKPRQSDACTGQKLLFLHNGETRAGRVVRNFKDISILHVKTLGKDESLERVEYDEVLEVQK